LYYHWCHFDEIKINILIMIIVIIVVIINYLFNATKLQNFILNSRKLNKDVISVFSRGGAKF